MAGDDLLVGDADRNDLHGDEGNDTLRSGTSGGALYGGEGDDVLDARAALDALDSQSCWLEGGTGRDAFRLALGDGAHHVVPDFCLGGGAAVPERLRVDVADPAGVLVDVQVTGTTTLVLLSGPGPAGAGVSSMCIELHEVVPALAELHPHLDPEAALRAHIVLV